MSIRPSLLRVELRVFRNGKVVVASRLSLAPSHLREFQKQAMRWQYIVRQRNRWSLSEDSRDSLEGEALATLEKLGAKRSELALIADTIAVDNRLDRSLARHVEVAIPWNDGVDDASNDDPYWCARIMPWEYLLSAATKRYRTGERIIVSRRLVMPSASPSAWRRSPASFSILEAAPGMFREHFDFDSENQLLLSNLRSLRFESLHRACGIDPDWESVKRWLRKSKPDILHVTGVDAELGAQLLGQQQEARKTGVYLAKKGREPQLIEYKKFAQGVCQEDGGPFLVSYNLWHSGSRLAPLSLFHGARNAIGFENTFDDNVAELFYGRLYASLAESQWNLRSSFLVAVDSIRQYSDRIRGAGIVLWTLESIFANTREAPTKSVIQRKEREADPALDRADHLVRVDIKPMKRVNYAYLHNRGSLLDSFSLHFSPTHDREEEDSERVVAIRGLSVQVTLCCGADTFPYRVRLDLDEETPLVQLSKPALQVMSSQGLDGIFVPLTSTLLRSVDESMLSSVHIRVDWHDQVLVDRTYPVQLAPVDEWRFDEDQIIWMPSFLQPRDEAVTRIIEMAQRYLVCLTDDSNAGFSGYQAYMPHASNPWKGVDDQVRAIWTAIALDCDLKYVNPPPSYSFNAQRLRMPTRVLHERRGTCVDLALLFAACLEWIDIYPVIFNLDDHAFPGYWRHPAGLERFQMEPRLAELEWTETVSEQLRWGRSKQLPPWYSPRDVYSEIREYVNPARRRGESQDAYEKRRALVPLETVWLTQRSGFYSAIEEGRAHFHYAANPKFHSMIEVVTSREWVTPLPLGNLTQEL